jgi:Flp pilus assembly pilin Flp
MATRLTRIVRRAAAGLIGDRSGATAIEYAMVAVGIGIAVAATVYAVGTSLDTNFYQKVEDATRQ